MEDKTTYILGEISTMKYGKLPPKEIDKGKYPIWSGYRIVGYCNEFNCAKGDVIIVARGVGGTGDVKIAKENCYLTNLSIHVKLDCNICLPEYFYYRFLLSNLKYLDSGSAQSQITIDDLKRLTLALPPLAQQYKTVNILRSFDNKIELNNRINHNLEEQAQALYKSWFVDFEPFKDGKFVESELGMIPHEWKILPFKDFLTPISKKVPVGMFSEYSVTNTGIIPRSEKFKKQLSGALSMNKELRQYDIVFGMSREILNWGIMLDEVGSVSSAYNIYDIDEEKINPLYLNYYIYNHLSYFNDLIGTAAREGQSLDKGALMQKLALVPPDDILNSFLKADATYRHSIVTNKKEIDVLKHSRDAIMEKLMSGELNINKIDC